MTTDSIEAQLAAFATTFEPAGIPETARSHARQLLIDGVACALAGGLAQETDGVARAAASLGEGPHTIMGRSERMSAVGATLLNSYLVTAMTVCDVYRPAHCHVTPLIVGPALAAAEEQAAKGRVVSGEEWLGAIAVGMEPLLRVARGLDYAAFRGNGWHSPGVVGPFGAAATVGRLSGFDTQTMHHAFGLAATQSAGSYLSWGTAAVKFHQARGAVSGLLSARMAEHGFVGGQQFLTAPDGGIFNTHSNGGIPEATVADLGAHWELEEVAIRLWPAASPVQTMLTGLFDIIAGEQLTLEDVARIDIGISREDFVTHGELAWPTGTFEALLSYRLLASAALADGQVWFEQVTPSRLGDPALRTFSDEKIAITPVDGLAVNACRLTVTTTDGRTFNEAVDESRGSKNNPASPANVADKFHQCADGVLGVGRAGEVLGILERIESVDDVGTLIDLLHD